MYICCGFVAHKLYNNNSTTNRKVHNKYVARGKFEVAQPIRCRLRAYLLFIRYVTLWPWTLIPCPWPLTLNICSLPAVPYSNSVWNMSSIGQSAAELLQFELWPYDLEHVPRVALCSWIVCTKFKLNKAIRSWNVTIFYANTPYHAMTLTFDSLTVKVGGRSGVTWT